MKKILMSVWIVLILLTGGSKFALADGVTVNLTVKNNGDVVYSDTIPLSPTSSEDNVLSVIKQADTLSPAFDISNIIHYSFGDYLKCITISGTTELCDNWLYKVNGDSPSVGMDSYVLLGGENIVLYFGDENKTPAPEIVPEPPEPETPATHSTSGGSGYIVFDTVCEQGQKFNINTGQPCTSFVLSPLLVFPALVPPSPLNTTFEEKSKNILPTSPKEQPKKISKITLGHSSTDEPNQNTTNIVNPVPSAPAQTKTTKDTWWERFWNKIFSVF